MLQRFKQDLKNDLIAGLLVVIPLATTIWLTVTISQWVITFLTRVPNQLNPFSDLDPLLGTFLNLLTGFAVPLLFIMFIGLMARNIVGRWLLDFGERILQAIPFAGSVYKTLKQLLETVLRDTNDRFRRVVWVEYPRQGVWALAFVTGAVTDSVTYNLPPRLEGPLVGIFIPTTPNPTSGWYAIVTEHDLVDTGISVEDAFKMLISGGVVGPNTSGDKQRSVNLTKKDTLNLESIDQNRVSESRATNSHGSPLSELDHSELEHKGMALEEQEVMNR